MLFKTGNCLLIFILSNLIVSSTEHLFDLDGVWIFGGREVRLVPVKYDESAVIQNVSVHYANPTGIICFLSEIFLCSFSLPFLSSQDLSSQ